MDGEQHDVAQLLPDAVVIALVHEIAAQAILAHIGLDGGGKAAFARDGERTVVEVGGENLDGRTQLVARRFLQ